MPMPLIRASQKSNLALTRNSSGGEPVPAASTESLCRLSGPGDCIKSSSVDETAVSSLGGLLALELSPGRLAPLAAVPNFADVDFDGLTRCFASLVTEPSRPATEGLE